MRATPTAGDHLQDALAGHFLDRVTILASTPSTNSYNESVDSFAPLADHIKLPAVIAPGDVYAKLKRQESMSTQGSTEIEYRRVMLNGYYPLIETVHRVLLNDDDYEWQIVAIISDQTNSFTQMLVERLEPGVV
jgi:hypothetical protein